MNLDLAVAVDSAEPCSGWIIYLIITISVLTAHNYVAPVSGFNSRSDIQVDYYSEVVGINLSKLSNLFFLYRTSNMYDGFEFAVRHWCILMVPACFHLTRGRGSPCFLPALSSKLNFVANVPQIGAGNQY